MTSVSTPPQVGDRYVWEIPDTFGPIFMIVHRTIGGRRPRVIFDCVGSGCRSPYRRTHRLPLTPNMRRRDWTEQDLGS